MIRSVATQLGESVDLTVRDRIRIRLISPTAGDVAAVERQLGAIQAPLRREPQLVIRFVPRLEIGPRAQLLGDGEIAFTRHNFLLLQPRHRARMQIPLDQLGGNCELVCQSGLVAVPLLHPLVNLTALAAGLLPMHAAAFSFQNRAVLVTGWANGGKTTTLLGFMARGAEFVGDDWVYVEPDTTRCYGLPAPLEIADRHLREFPRFRQSLTRGDRMRLRTTRLLTRALLRAATSFPGQRVLPTRTANKLAPLSRHRGKMNVFPQQLFGNSPQVVGPLDRIFLTVSHAAPDICVRPVEPQQVAERIAIALEQEFAGLKSVYLKFRFAFPERSNPWIDRSEALLRQRVGQVLQRTKVYGVYHPYPPTGREMFEAIQPWL